jgi:hypothetical protein
MSDLTLMDNPVLSPGKCIRCSDYKGPVIDLGLDLWDGRLYLCVRCVDSIIEVRGGASPEQVSRFEALLNDAHERIDELKAQKQEAKREFVSQVADSARQARPSEMTQAESPSRCSTRSGLRELRDQGQRRNGCRDQAPAEAEGRAVALRLRPDHAGHWTRCPGSPASEARVKLVRLIRDLLIGLIFRGLNK